MADSISSGSGGGGLSENSDSSRLEEYIETFITILIILNIRRRKQPTTGMYVYLHNMCIYSTSNVCIFFTEWLYLMRILILRARYA